MDCRRLEVGDHVTQLNTKNPVGVIEKIWLGDTGEFAKVRWGTADRRTFRDDFPIADLERLDEVVYSPDEVVERQAKEAGATFVEDE